MAPHLPKKKRNLSNVHLSLGDLKCANVYSITGLSICLKKYQNSGPKLANVGTVCLSKVQLPGLLQARFKVR